MAHIQPPRTRAAGPSEDLLPRQARGSAGNKLLRELLGPVGAYLGVARDAPAEVGRTVAAAIETLGYGSLWFGEAIGGPDAFVRASYLLAETSRIVVGTGIANVRARHPAAMQGAADTVGSAWPSRFVHGVGVGHGPPTAGSGQPKLRPLAHMAEYLAAMDAVDTSLDRTSKPRSPRVVGALGPRMLELARNAADGALTYFMPPSHAPLARQALGHERLLLVEQSVVLGTEPTRARRVAREWMQPFLGLRNYREGLRQLGFGDDLANGGTDRLVDAVVVWGDETAIRARVDELRASGADSVLLQVLAPDPSTMVEHLARLAPAMPRGSLLT